MNNIKIKRFTSYLIDLVIITTFNKITALLQEINASLIYQDVEFEIRTEYPIEYMELIIDRYIKLFNINFKFINNF